MMSIKRRIRSLPTGAAGVEMVDKRAASHPGVLHVKLVDLFHQLKVADTKTRSRSTVVAGTGNA
jgi:hypothetical protein